MSEPRTHYQISLTARQAVGAFLGLLAALSLAFFFGLMTGLSGRETPEGRGPELVAVAAGAETVSEPMPPIETAVPPAAVPVGPVGSRTELAGGAGVPTPPPAEPTAPGTLHPFQDGAANEASAITEASGGKSPAAAKPEDLSAGTFWVQVASLSSRDEASRLSGRLARHGFRSQVLTAAGPKGKGRVYRVRVGPYRSEDDAGRAADKLSKQENVKSPWVVPDGK